LWAVFGMAAFGAAAIALLPKHEAPAATRASGESLEEEAAS